MREAIQQSLRQRKDFVIIGLTGRTGSGVSTVARILTNDFKDIQISNYYSGDTLTNDNRSHNIIRRFSKKNWHKFILIKVRDIITSFILECKFNEFKAYIVENYGTDIENLRKTFDEFYEKNKVLDHLILGNIQEANHKLIYTYITKELPLFTDKLKEALDINDGCNFVPAYQEIGNNIRSYGVATKREGALYENVFSLSRRINSLIKSIRRYNKSILPNPPKNYFVIDSFKNPIEVSFFKERYSAFYLFAVNSTESDRKDRLLTKLKITPNKLIAIDKKENPKKDLLDSHSLFIGQNVKKCIQFADIFINNSGDSGNIDFRPLGDKIVRYVSLVQHPGLVTPTRDEFIMQIAFTAMLNSGCISRQVGAVVTNSDDAPKTIGWNNTPEGQTPCIYRNVYDLINQSDKKSYSYYEMHNEKVIELAKSYRDEIGENLSIDGLNASYCFKKIQNTIESDKNQVHTRALHAEENAILQAAKYGNEALKGGRLFTTSSSCVLCSKKAYQVGIKEIVYIEPYPDIAEDHIIRAGERNINIKLFSGAIGSAYHKLYYPIFSFKDELSAYKNLPHSDISQDNSSNEEFSLP